MPRVLLDSRGNIYRAVSNLVIKLSDWSSTILFTHKLFALRQLILLLLQPIPCHGEAEHFYCNLTVHELLCRLVHVKMLAYVASNQRYVCAWESIIDNIILYTSVVASIEVIKSQIVPLLETFAQDGEPAIRQNLVEQMVPFSKVTQ